MLSGLEVAAQEGVIHVCGDTYHFESDTPENYALVTDSETIYPNSAMDTTSNLGYVTVWNGLQYSYVDAGDTVCAVAESDEQETAMMTWIHEARQRGVFDKVFGRGGE